MPGKQVATDDGKAALRQLIRSALLLLRWLARLCAAGYFLSLVLLWLFFRYKGENNLTLAFALYLPPAGWGLPLVVIGPLVLLFDWRSLSLVVASVALLALGFLGWRWHSPQSPPAGAPVLTVLTFNRGESRGSLEPFKNKMKPDVMVFQDADNRTEKYLRVPGYEEFQYGEGIGEFVLVSRFPVTSKELISDGAVAVAGRFTIDWQGRSVVIYSMHLPTPRHALASLTHGAFLWGILGVSGSWAEKRESDEAWWKAQISHAETLRRRAEAETLPCLVVGDSNAPAPGYIHHLLTSRLVDSHEIAGSGCGMSFPGTTHNPLSLGGPWLRIDKLLASPQWRVLWNVTEPDRPSQHRSVAAAFALPNR